MRNVWTIARREYKLYFISPIAYVVAFLFLIIVGLFFYLQLRDAIQASLYQPYTPNAQMVTGSIMVFLLIFTMPAVTMRLLSEEQRSGTLELLMTAPIRDWELVVGKWLGGLMYTVSLLLVTLVFPIALHFMSEPGIDMGPVLTGYLGLTLMVASLIAIGVAISSLFTHQIAAFFVSLAIVLFLWFARPSSSATGWWPDVVNYLNFIEHYINFYRGIIEIKDVVYYLSLTLLGLFLGSVSVESRRWR